MKERNDEKYKDIDADLDEASIIYNEESSQGTWKTVDTKAVESAPESIEVKQKQKTPKVGTGIERAYEDDNNKSEKAPLFCDCEGGCVIS